MQDSDNNLTPNQVKVLASLLAGRSVEAAAKEAGVNPATVHRWLNDPAFQAAQRDGRRLLAQQGLSLIQVATRTAVATVVELMSDKTKPPSVRLRAAQIIIESTVKWIELDDLATRLAALEGKHAKP